VRGGPQANALGNPVSWDHDSASHLGAIFSAIPLVKGHWAIWGNKAWAQSLIEILKTNSPNICMTAVRELLGKQLTFSLGNGNRVSMSVTTSDPRIPQTPLITTRDLKNAGRIRQLQAEAEGAVKALEPIDWKLIQGDSLTPSETKQMKALMGQRDKARGLRNVHFQHAADEMRARNMAWGIVVTTMKAMRGCYNPNHFPILVGGLREGWQDMEKLGHALENTYPEQSAALVTAAKNVAAAIECFDNRTADRNQPLLNMDSKERASAQAKRDRIAGSPPFRRVGDNISGRTKPLRGTISDQAVIDAPNPAGGSQQPLLL